MRCFLRCGLIAAAISFCLPVWASEALRLTTDDVVRLVLERNLEAQIAQLARDAVAEGVPQAKGVFDTNLSVDASHQIDKFKRTTEFFGDRIDTTIWNLSLTKELPSGTLAGLNFKNVREQIFGAPVINGIPVYPSVALYEPILEFSITQPLMQNALGYLDRHTVSEARLAFEAADYDTQQEVQRIVFQSLVDYWNLLLFGRLHEAMLRSVRDARGFLATTIEKERLGTAEETDVLAARANVLKREGDAMSVANEAGRWAERLRVDLALGPEVVLEAEDLPRRFRDSGRSRDDRIAAAFELRADYKAAKKELDRQNVRLSMAKNSRWPQLDLVSTLQLNEIDASYADALGDINSPNWMVGVSLRVPLENRAARAGRRRVEVERAGAILAVKALEVAIANEVARSHAELGSRRTIMEKMERAKRLEREKLGQELLKYEHGRSSADTIIRFQDDFVEAERRAVEAWRGYVTSVFELMLAEGSILDLMGEGDS